MKVTIICCLATFLFIGVSLREPHSDVENGMVAHA